MAYLVTGGTGFTGSYTVRDLVDAGKEVVCLQRSGITPLFRQVLGEDRIAKVKVMQGDYLSDTIALFNLIRDQRIDLIVHIGYVLAPVSEEQPAYALRANCDGMSNMLEAVRLLGLKRLVWTCSGSAFGRASEFYKGTLGNDDAIFFPTTFYGATKVLNEFMARHYFEKFGTDSIGLRIPVTYGVGKNGRGRHFNQFLREAALNKPATRGTPDLTNAYLYVEDASAVIVKACDAPTPKNRIFNVAEGSYTNRQLIDLIRKVNPDAQVKLLEDAVTAFDHVVSSNRETEAVKKELGWQPKYSFEEGMRKSFTIWRRQEGLPPLRSVSA